VHRSDLNTIDLGIERYDIITSIDVLCQRQIDDDLSVCRKFLDALRPGGLLVLQVPAYEWLRSSHDDAVQTGRRYTRSGVVSMLRSSGFFVERATYRVGLFFLPIAALRTLGNLMRRLTGRSPSGSDVKQHSIIVNRVLLAIMRFENAVLSRMTLPFGTSLFMLGRKKTAGATPKAGSGK
jgi:2-polyprenyl-3-methyl-5-hydroxy-6-metoxy-1,4-benzoquinol methylase